MTWSIILAAMGFFSTLFCGYAIRRGEFVRDNEIEVRIYAVVGIVALARRFGSLIQTEALPLNAVA